MSSVEIVHRERFCAAHRLWARSLSDEENRRIYGPCARLHGHEYELEVAVRGPVDPRTGMVMNLDDLQRVMVEEIVQEVDHRYLNEEVPFLKDLEVTTTENLAIAFWARLAAHESEWGSARLHRVRLSESTSNAVDYFGPGS